MKNYIVKINSLDNVAIAVEDLPSGTIINEELTAIEEIPQAHKIALADIPKGGEIRRYNTIIGYAKEDIKKGRWINQYMVNLPTAPTLNDLEFATNIVTDLPTDRKSVV